MHILKKTWKTNRVDETCRRRIFYARAAELKPNISAKNSTDGKNYSEPLHHMGVFSEMLEKRYKGELYLKYEFTVQNKKV